MANNSILASDNFASGSLAAGWSAMHGIGTSVITGGAPFYAETSAVNVTSGQNWTGLTWPADQISEATIQTLNALGAKNQLQLSVRFSYNGTNNQGYVCTIDHGSGIQGTLTVYVNAGQGGGIVQLGSQVTSLTISPGDIWTLSASGTLITVYQNFRRIFYIGDATITSGGAPGFAQGVSSDSAITNNQVASWRGYSGVQQDGTWTKQGVIFSATAAEIAAGGNFGTGVTGLQGVIYDTNPQILAGPSVYKGWFTNLNGVNYAESADGISWTRYSSNPVISAYANGQIFKYNGTFYHWGQKAAEIGTGTAYFSTSADGINWSAQTITTGLTPSNGTYFNMTIADVIGGVFQGLYSATNGTGLAGNTYLATSSDGIAWTIQNSGNPVLANVFIGASFVKIGSTYYMWATQNQPGQGNLTAPGFDPLETVLYSSTDLIHWTLVHHSIHASGMWESLNSSEAGAYATTIIQMPTANRVGMYYVGSPGDSTPPAMYQGGLALAVPGSTIAEIVAANEDGTVQVASDSFTSGTGPLSANWTTQAGAGALQIVSGPYVQSTNTAGTRCVGLYTGASFGVNQYSEITIQTLSGAPGTNQIFPLVLGQVATHTYYAASLITATGTISSGTNFQINKSVNGVSAQLSSTPSPNNITLHVGDVIRLASTQGSDGSIVLTVYQNGFQVLQAQDYAASITSGFPGMQMNTAVEASAQVSLWAGGNTGLLAIGGRAGLAGATVSYSGTTSGNVTADSNGNYVITGLQSGSYIITPSGGTFTPASQVVALNGFNGVANFTAGANTAYSVPDCRVSYCGLVPTTNLYPNGNRTVNGTKIYDVETSNNAAVPGTDSRVQGAPVASGTYPQNSRAPGTYGPGE